MDNSCDMDQLEESTKNKKIRITYKKFKNLDFKNTYIEIKKASLKVTETTLQLVVPSFQIKNQILIKTNKKVKHALIFQCQIPI